MVRQHNRTACSQPRPTSSIGTETVEEPLTAQHAKAKQPHSPHHQRLNSPQSWQYGDSCAMLPDVSCCIQVRLVSVCCACGVLLPLTSLATCTSLVVLALPKASLWLCLLYQTPLSGCACFTHTHIHMQTHCGALEQGKLTSCEVSLGLVRV